ncbi:MAG: PhoU domain-containing protein, partial [Sulfolobales archaeon]
MDDSLRSEIRALQKVGGSLALYLPKEWCEANNLSKGSKVNLRYTTNFICLDVDVPDKSKSLAIDTSSLLEGELKYVLISLYILGYDRVKFLSNRRISLPLRRYITSSLRYTPDFKISDEGDNFITIKRIGEGEELIKSLTREFASVSTVFRYALEALESDKDLWYYHDAVEELDTEVDRARVEVERTAYKLTERPYSNPAKLRYIIPSVIISKLLERLADHIALLISELENSDKELRKNVSQTLKELENTYEELKKIFGEYYLRRGPLGVDDIAPIISKLVYIIENKKAFREASIKSFHELSNELLVYHIIRIYDYITDIAEVLINVLLDSLEPSEV